MQLLCPVQSVKLSLEEGMFSLSFLFQVLFLKSILESSLGHVSVEEPLMFFQSFFCIHFFLKSHSLADSFFLSVNVSIFM